jgi:cytochrome b
MLNDMILLRSAAGTRGPDLHRYATFSCSWHAIMRYVGIDR